MQGDKGMVKKIKVVHNGIEKEYDVIFSFKSKKDDKRYIVYTCYEEENNEIKCYSSLYENNQILPIESNEVKESINIILDTLNYKYSNSSSIS